MQFFYYDGKVKAALLEERESFVLLVFVWGQDVILFKNYLCNKNTKALKNTIFNTFIFMGSIFKAHKCICECKKLNMTSPVTNICGL